MLKTLFPEAGTPETVDLVGLKITKIVSSLRDEVFKFELEDVMGGLHDLESCPVPKSVKVAIQLDGEEILHIGEEE